jgi:uncharacterized membrane protein
MASLLRTPGDGEPGFRWRGTEISRTENLSDAVFGFAITLLVVSTEVPRTFAELQHLLRGFVPFGVCVLLFGLIWKAHYTFFRRFGLEDRVTMLLNAALLFVVVFFLYPLKFLAVLLFDLATGVPQQAATPGDADRLLVIYSAGYVAIFVLFALLYGHALRLRGQLGLSDEETAITRLTRALFLVHVGVAAAAMTVALLWQTGGIAGGIYFLIGPLSYALERRHARRGPSTPPRNGIAGTKP